MNVVTYHRQLTQKLADIGNLTAELDARLLICHALGLDFTRFIMQQAMDIAPKQLAQLEKYSQLALAHMPVSRILKKRQFWGLDFTINSDVLDPRADSEVMIEALLHFVPQSTKPLRILDLGTGSGCLLLSLLSEFSNATGLGTDLSNQALKVATQNAELLDLSERVNFIQSDWFEQIPLEKFDIIISNPPYIPTEDIDDLAENVKLYDPLPALDGGDDGLNPYRIIAKNAEAYLAQNGILAFEMGHDQADALFDILATNKFSTAQFDMHKFTPVGLTPVVKPRDGLAYDLGQNPRVIISSYKG